MWAVMPPRANEAFTPASNMEERRYFTAANEAPPLPVWMEKPFLK